MNQFLLFSRPDCRARLEAELANEGWTIEALPGPGAVVATPGDAVSPYLAFVTQALPLPEWLAAESIREAAARVVERLLSMEPLLLAREWCLEVFPADGAVTVGERRATLIREAILELLRKKRRSLVRALRTSRGSTCLVQVALMSLEEVALSIDREGLLQRLPGWFSPAPGGFVTVEEDRSLPSRAYKKMAESCAILGREPRRGERVVDLGASPGSWSFWCAARGGQVTAIDRSGPAESPYKVSWMLGDAFSFKPETPVDWLLCDVAAFPQVTLAMLREWLASQWCHAFVVTLKFKDGDFNGTFPAVIGEAKRLLGSSASRGYVRHLRSNGNEVMVFGGCDEQFLVGEDERE